MNQGITIAVVGAGRWGRNLIKTFAQLGVLAAIVEPNIVQGKELAQYYNVEWYQDIDHVLALNINAVAIATPVFTHYALARKALLAKKDVFVEKPITTRVGEAQQLIELASQHACVLMVGHLLLYQPGIHFIKEWLTAGKLGAVHSFRQTRRSLGTIRKEENVLYSLGVHDLAVLQYLIPERVVAVRASSIHAISAGIADDMTIYLRYRSSLQAHLHLSWLWPIKDRQLMILGEKGALHFNENSQEVIYYQHYGNPDCSVTQAGHAVLFNDATPPLTLELQHFLGCIRSRQQPRSCGVQGREVVQLMDRIMHAQETIDDKLCSA